MKLVSQMNINLDKVNKMFYRMIFFFIIFIVPVLSITDLDPVGLKKEDAQNKLNTSFLSRIEPRMNGLPDQIPKVSFPDFNENSVLHQEINENAGVRPEKEIELNLEGMEHSKEKSRNSDEVKPSISTTPKPNETDSSKVQPFYPKMASAIYIDRQTKCILLFIAALLFILVISTTSKMFESIYQINLENERNKGIPA